MIGGARSTFVIAREAVKGTLHSPLLKHALDKMDQTQVSSSLEQALTRLCDVDAYLLRTGVNERSVTHRLGMYLQAELPLWDVDCEYNRAGLKPKRAVLPVTRVDTDDLKARTVYPDIIVHRRGPLGPNLLAIELKIDATPDERAWDFRKLDAYRQQFEYLHGAFVDLRIRESAQVVFEVHWLF